MNEHSVTRWIGEVKVGDEAAAQALWSRYFEKLVRVCQKKMRPHPRRSEDGEDVAISAVARVFVGLRTGVFPQVTDRDDLWRLLVRIAADKAVDRIRHLKSKKGGAGRVFDESILGHEDPERITGLEQVMGAEPSPEFAAILLEQYERLLRRLSSDELRTVAVLKMQGYSQEEIAAIQDCAVRTVQRRLWLIRKEWREWVDEQDEASQSDPEQRLPE